MHRSAMSGMPGTRPYNRTGERMGAAFAPPRASVWGENAMANRYAFVFPPRPIAGVSGVCVPEERLREMASLEAERKVQLWTVRAIISDHVPLYGELDNAIQRQPQHSLLLNQNPLTIYLSHNGRNPVYFDLIGGRDNLLSHIELRVETDLPDKAIRLAWEPFSTLLDSIVRTYPLPLIISRLELLSPTSGDVIAYNLLLPNSSGLSMGPLGGIVVSPEFIPADAIWREALISSSPFYRLLCGYRMYDACDDLRALMRATIEKRGLSIKLPPEQQVEPKVLIELGMSKEEAEPLNKLQKLLKHYLRLRNGIAHFTIDDDSDSGKKLHAFISNGDLIRVYSIASNVILHYAHLKVEGLRSFFVKNGLGESMRGTILPLPQRKLDFPVRDPSIHAGGRPGPLR